MKTNKIAILMSTYNGEKYIRNQLDSLLKQKDVNIEIIIRDDGSKDNTVKIIKEYINKNDNIKLIGDNKNLGYAYSFWYILRNIDDKYDYYAFCDQDDIWDEKKIISAIKKIEKYENIPALYTSRVVSVNNDMEVINENTFSCNRVLNKYESFQKSVVPGCVFVFNRQAKQLVSVYNGYLESHDWATYAIVNSFGKVVYDNNSYIKYRIHDNNAIGKKNKLGMLVIKIKRFFKKSKCVRSKFAKDFYETYLNYIDDKKYKDSIEELAYYKKSINLKRRLIFNRKYKGIVFKIYVLLSKV